MTTEEMKETVSDLLNVQLVKYGKTIIWLLITGVALRKAFDSWGEGNLAEGIADGLQRVIDSDQNK